MGVFREFWRNQGVIFHQDHIYQIGCQVFILAGQARDTPMACSSQRPPFAVVANAGCVCFSGSGIPDGTTDWLALLSTSATRQTCAAFSAAIVWSAVRSPFKDEIPWQTCPDS